jgi:hypothetical protein
MRPVFRRSVHRSLAVRVAIAVALAVGCGMFAAHGPAARAASTTHAASTASVPSYEGRGPSAAVDKYNDQYVFWRGGDGNLWEAWYDAYTGAWQGPINLGMGQLGSEPSVVVSWTQNFAGPGGHPYNPQYVYWKGNGTNTIYMAYWQGSWHGPVRLAPDEIQANSCSQPGAGILNPPSGQHLDLYWEGIGTSATSSCDSHLYQGWTNATNPVSAYQGPEKATEAGSIGSAPAVGTSYDNDLTTGALCLCEEMIAWTGEDGALWSEHYTTGGSVSNAVVDSTSGQLGSPPSVGDAFTFNVPVFQVAWRGQDGALWLSVFDAGDNHYSSPEVIQAAGILGSAPSFASVPPNIANAYIFWKGVDGNLWEGLWNAANSTWSAKNLGMGQLG